MHLINYTYNKPENGLSTVRVSLTNVDGTALDFDNLTEEDITTLTNAAKTYDYPEYMPEFLAESDVRIYNATKTQNANIIYMGENFDGADKKAYLLEGKKLHRTPALRDNQMLVISTGFSGMACPAYRNGEGEIVVHNKNLLENLVFSQKAFTR